MHRPSTLLLTAITATSAVCSACNDYDIVKQPMRETFYQSDRKQVDLLFVIDDSPSMYEEADAIQTATTALITTLVQLDVDTRVRSVSTSSVSLLEWTTADALSQIPDLVEASRVGTDGAREEAGLAVAVDFTDGVREDATLHVAIISDEDDASPEPVDTYTDLLTTRSSRGARVHPISGDLPAGCAHNGLAADPSPRYRDAAAATEGTPLSICSATLADELGTLSFELTGLRDRFVLSSLPEPSTLLVWVEGAVVTRAKVHGWHWNAAANAIEFHGLAIPPPRARIEVEYDVGRPEAGTGIAELPDDTAAP